MRIKYQCLSDLPWLTIADNAEWNRKINPFCYYRDTYCTNKSWSNKILGMFLFFWMQPNYNWYFCLCISNAVSILGAAFLAISQKNYLHCTTHVHAVTPICSSGVYKSKGIRNTYANAVCVPHQPELCFLSSETDSSVKSRDFLVLNQMKNPGLLNIWRLYQANIKLSISMENFTFRSHERIGFVEKGFIGLECIFFGQDSFSHVEVMRKDFLFFLFRWLWLDV